MRTVGGCLTGRPGRHLIRKSFRTFARTSRGRAAIVSAAALVATWRAPNAIGQTFVTWDASGDSPSSPTDGNGTWSTRVTNWSNGSSDVAWTNGFVADIGNGGTAGTITVNDGAGNVSALGMYFTEPYTIATAAGQTVRRTR